MPSIHHPRLRTPLPRHVFSILCWLLSFSLTPVRAEDSGKRNFNLPADSAERTLNLFSEQSGRGLIAGTDTVKGIKTNAVQGNFTPREALDQMLIGTGLVAEEDQKNGAFTVHRGDTDPNAQRVAQTNDSDHPARPTDAAGASAGAGSDSASGAPLAFGMITGTIEDAATGEYLPSAEVAVEGTSLKTVSERYGTFSFEKAPAGQVTLVVNFSGMQTTEQRLVVAPGQTSSVVVAMQPEVLTMEPYKVEAGLVSGMSLAVNLEHEAPNVEAVMDSAAYGPIAQADIGDFLRMLPGVTSRMDNTTIDKLQVRGMPENFTSVMVDGTKFATSNSTLNDYQRVDLIPAENVARAEVVYAPTPDMDADSLGAVINLETKSGWDVDHRITDLSASANYNLTFKDHIGWRSDKSVTPNFGFDYGDRYSVFGGTNNLGIFLNANSDEFFTGRASLDETFNPNWTVGTPSLGTLKDYQNEQYDFTRNTGSLRLDFRTQTGDRFHFQTGAERYRYYSGSPLDDFNNKKGTVDPSSTTYLWVVDKAQYDGSEKLDNNVSLGDQFHFWAEHARGPWKLDYDFSYSNSRWNEDLLLLDLVSANVINYTLNRQDATAPVFTQTAGVPIATDNFTNVASSTFNAFHNTYDNSIGGAKVDLSRSFDELRFPFNLKAGFRYRRDDTSEDSNEFIAAGASNVPWPTYIDAAASNRQGTLYTKSFPQGSIPAADVFASAAGVKFIGGSNPLAAWQYNPAMLTPNAAKILSGSLGNDASLQQAIDAGYLQGDVTAGKLNILGGVRFERTDISGAGVVSNAITSTSTYSPLPASGSYTDWFPSLHLKYQPTDRIVIRGSYGTTIGRPNVTNIIPSASVASNNVVTFSNPGLKPELAHNLDLQAEYYFEPAGMVSLGVFEKKISNFLVTDTGIVGQPGFPNNGLDLASYIGDQGITSINGGSAQTRGLALNYDQFFRFLPGVLSGLGAFFNFTWQEPSGNFGAGTPIDDAPGFRKQCGNYGLSWVYGRFDIRANCNYIGKYLNSASTSDPSLNDYKNEQTNWNIFLKCRLTRELEVFLNVINVTQNEQQDQDGLLIDYRLSTNVVLARWATCGIKASF